MRLYQSLNVVIMLAAPAALDVDGGSVLCRRDIVCLGELNTDMFEYSERLSSMFCPPKTTNGCTRLEVILRLLQRAIVQQEQHEDGLRPAARGGAKIALELLMAHHLEVDIGGMTEFMPVEDSEGKGIDQNELLDCVAGYATQVADMVNVEAYYKRHDVPKDPDKESFGVSDDNTDEDGEAGSLRVRTKAMSKYILGKRIDIVPTAYN